MTIELTMKTIRKIKLEDARSLPIHARVAFAASVVEPVLHLYSDYFQKKFMVNEILDEAWKFAGGEAINLTKARNLTDSVSALADDADDEGYAFGIMFLHGHVLAEVLTQDGKSAFAAVEDAAYAFAAHYVFQVGFMPTDGNIPKGYVGTLEQELHEKIARLFPYYMPFEGRSIRRDETQLLNLPSQVPPLNLAAEIIRPKRLPPTHERKSTSLA